MHSLLFTSHRCFTELSIHVILAVIFFSGDHRVKYGYHVFWWHSFPMIMMIGLFVIHVIVIGSCFVFVFTLTLCLTVRSSAVEHLIVSTLVQ